MARLTDFLAAARNRQEARRLRRWQLIRRLGQQRFIILHVLGFWLVMVACFFYAAWRFDPSFQLLHRLPPHFYRKLLFLVPVFSIILYFGFRYAWRENERRYENDRNA